MINKEQNPAGWAIFMYELEDALEHLDQLITQLDTDPDFDETCLRIHLKHVYSHLNRAWYCRTKVENISEQEWHTASQFPKDLEPI